MPSINDDFADAIEVTIATNGGTYTSDALANTGNTTETDEPQHVSNSLSMWFKYTPTSSGTATLDTVLSTAITGTDTVLVVYTGTAVDSLTYVTHDDDSGGSGKSQITDMAVTAGTTYRIQACGYGFSEQNMVLRVTGPATTSGGTSYDKTPADAEGITDARTVVQDAARSQADPVGLTDTRSAAQDNARAPADPLGITDSVLAEFTGTITRTPADDVGLTDAVAVVVTLDRTTADPVGVTDTDTPLVIELEDVTGDAVGLTDSVTVVRAVVTSAADTLGITDTATATGEGDETATPADDVPLSDAAARVLDSIRTPADLLALTDTTAATSTAARGPADVAPISDTVVAVMERIVAVTDSLTVADTATHFTGVVATPASRIVTVPAENRLIDVPPENRIMEA